MLRRGDQRGRREENDEGEHRGDIVGALAGDSADGKGSRMLVLAPGW